MLIALVVYCGSTAWTIWVSMTSSRMLPTNNFVGLRQDEILFANERWLDSVAEPRGVRRAVHRPRPRAWLLPCCADRSAHSVGGPLRSIFLYPFSMSFIVTGLAWRWLLDPTLGIAKIAHEIGFEGVQFDWLVRQDRVIYTLVAAAIWHASGLVMAIMLRPARHRSGDLESHSHRRHSGLAHLHLRRHPDADG